MVMVGGLGLVVTVGEVSDNRWAVHTVPWLPGQANLAGFYRSQICYTYSTPLLLHHIRSPVFWLAQLLAWALTVRWIFKSLNKSGVGSMSGVIVILTRGIGERLTHGILLLSCCLGGMSGRLVLQRSALLCRRFFRWSFGSVPQPVSRGEYTCLCVRLGRRALNRNVLLLVLRMNFIFFSSANSTHPYMSYKSSQPIVVYWIHPLCIWATWANGSLFPYVMTTNWFITGLLVYLHSKFVSLSFELRRNSIWCSYFM